MIRRRLLLGAALLLVAFSKPTPPVDLSVLPRVAPSPATVRLTVRTPRDARNRHLVIGIAGEPYYRSSYEQLDGEDAPAIRSLLFDHIPGGHYVAFAALLRNDGTQARASESICVTGMFENCQSP